MVIQRDWCRRSPGQARRSTSLQGPWERSGWDNGQRARGVVGSSVNLSQESSKEVFLLDGFFLLVQICAERETFPLQTHPLFPRLLKRLRYASDWHVRLEKLQRIFASVIFESKPPTHLDSVPHLILPFSLAFYKNICAVVGNIHPAFVPTHIYFVLM